MDDHSVSAAELLFDRAMRSVAVQSLPSYPWERRSRGPISLALGTDRPLAGTTTSVKRRPLRLVEKKRPQTLLYEPSVAAKRRRTISTVVRGCQEDARAEVLMKWVAILEVDLGASVTGKQLAKLTLEDAAEGKVEKLLGDTFAKKSTGTLRVRATALLLYEKWHHSMRRTTTFPLIEDDVYEYMGELEEKLKKGEAGASRANSLMEAWGFCVYVLGFQDSSNVLTSQRCKGSAHRQLLAKKPRKRAQILSVPQMCGMELAAIAHADPRDRAICGLACLMLYGRSGQSDVQRASGGWNSSGKGGGGFPPQFPPQIPLRSWSASIAQQLPLK